MSVLSLPDTPPCLHRPIGWTDSANKNDGFILLTMPPPPPSPRPPPLHLPGTAPHRTAPVFCCFLPNKRSGFAAAISCGPGADGNIGGQAVLLRARADGRWRHEAAAGALLLFPGTALHAPARSGGAPHVPTTAVARFLLCYAYPCIRFTRYGKKKVCTPVRTVV